MFVKSRDKNIIFTNSGHKPSKFLVDLNRVESAISAHASSGFFSRFFSKQNQPLKNSSQLEYGLGGHQDHDKNEPGVREDLKIKVGVWQKKHGPKLKRLAIFPLIKALFLLIYHVGKATYKLFYAGGWLTLFVVRFVYFFCSRILIFVFNLLTFFKFKRGVSVKPERQTKLENFPAAFYRKNKNKIMAKTDTGPDKGTKKTGTGSRNFKILNSIKQAISIILIYGLIQRLIKRHRELEIENYQVREAPVFSFKKVLIFSLILLALIIPVKAYWEYKNLHKTKSDLIDISKAAVSEIMTASESAQNLQFADAGKSLASASASFSKAQTEISDINLILGPLAAIVPNKDLQMAANADLVLEAGKLSSRVGAKLLAPLEKIPSGKDGDIKVFFDDLYLNVKSAAVDSAELTTVTAKIKTEYLPAEYRDKFVTLKEKTVIIANALLNLTGILEKMRIFLGWQEDKRYLLVFQNNAEMRASGGFVGGYALLDLKQGQVKNLEIPGGGSYDTEGGLYERIIAPEPLYLVNPLWHFWDANWWPDWPRSAKKLAWFYERSGGPTVDGVISLTPTVVENLLGIIGPIDLSAKYGVIFSKDNFWLETQTYTEETYKVSGAYKIVDLATTSQILEDSSVVGTEKLASASPSLEENLSKNKPKKIIGDLFNALIEELPSRLNKDKGLALIKLFEDSLNEKQIMFYFYDQALADEVKKLGWDGRQKETAKDYLMVVNTNIAGGKSDRKIEEKIEHQTQVDTDGTVIDTVFVKRTHTGIKNEKFVGVRNVDWLRIYVPAGSVLIEASGFIEPDKKYFEQPDPDWSYDPDLGAERSATSDPRSGTKIYQENGKTVFANWCMVDPGKTVTIYLKYKLPFKIALPPETGDLTEHLEDILSPDKKELLSYSLLLQKQPGSIGSKIESRLILPPEFRIVWVYPDDMTATALSWNTESNLRTDKFYAALIEPVKQ